MSFFRRNQVLGIQLEIKGVPLPGGLFSDGALVETYIGLV